MNEDDVHATIQKEALNDKSDESKTGKILRRCFLILVGLFLLYLSLTYLGVGPYLFQIFEGQIVSEQLHENLTLFLGNKTTVVFTEEVYNQLLAYYTAHQRYEFVACFSGSRTVSLNDTTYILTLIEIPHMYTQSVHRVVSTGCSAETLVSLHTHPYKHCLFSTQDIESFFIYQQRSPHGLYALMCEENRFTFYGY